MTKTIPSRVHIILARDAPTAVALRRGPSKRVCSVGWDRKTDTFRVGQWFTGRIYERLCDLSPDGKHLIYFAMNGKWEAETKGSWTAISSAPYLKAIGLWANGTGWPGGGLFTSDNKYWMDTSRFVHQELLAPQGLQKDDHFPWQEAYGGERRIYNVRLQRDGWRLSCHERVETWGKSVFEKPVLKGWVLEKTEHTTIAITHPDGKGLYSDTHRLKKEDGNATIDLPDWEWAELDGDRIVWVAAGVLYTAHLNAQGLLDKRVLFDFNPLTFEELQAAKDRPSAQGTGPTAPAQ